MDELERIRRAYERRDSEIPPGRYAATQPAQLLLRQTRERAAIRLLRPLLPLRTARVLDVGCGDGEWLHDFERWGARRENLSGIELRPAELERASRRLCALRDDSGAVIAAGADLRAGDASSLPWPDGSKDVVVQSLVFSSVLDPDMRRRIAGEMARVLAPGGFILSYDFFVDSPRNREVRGVGRRALRSLFPGFELELRRVTLAPPLARLVAPRAWLAAELLEALRLLNTHLIVRLSRPG